MDEHIARLTRYINDLHKRLEEVERRLDDLELLRLDPDGESIEHSEEIMDVKYPTGGPGG